MIENPFPISVKPGLFLGDHSDKESAGRWIDGDAVSFAGPEGFVRPIESAYALTKAADLFLGSPRGAMFAWQDSTDFGRGKALISTNTGSPTFAGKMFLASFLTSNTITFKDITHTDHFSGDGGLTAGVRENEVFYMFNSGSGTESALYRYDLDTPTVVSSQIANFTNTYAGGWGIAITPEDFLVAIVRGNLIAWASQGTSSTWAPSGTNSAGSLPMSGALPLRIVVVGRETLILTVDGSVWALDYVGGDLIYGLRQISPGAGIIGPNAVAVVHSTVYWMGTKGFYQYDGFVRDIPSSDINSYVFDDLIAGADLIAKYVYTTVHETRKEIWWHYPTAFNAGAARVVIYNYENQTWSKIDSFDAPAGAGVVSTINGVMKEHHIFVDSLLNVTAFPAPGSVRAGAFVESGLLPFDDGSHQFRVNKVIHDGAGTSDAVTIYSRLTDNGSELTHPMIPDSDGETDTRFLARYIRYKHVFASGTTGVGIPKLGVIQSGTR